MSEKPDFQVKVEVSVDDAKANASLGELERRLISLDILANQVGQRIASLPAVPNKVFHEVVEALRLARLEMASQELTIIFLEREVDDLRRINDSVVQSARRHKNKLKFIKGLVK